MTPLQQPIEISLSGNSISLKIPSQLQQSFTITNLTLRPVIICPILSHEDELFLSTNNRIMILEAFQEVEMTIGLKSISLPVREIIRPMLRLYYWEIKSFSDEDEMLLEQDQQILNSPKRKSQQPKSYEKSQNQPIPDSHQNAPFVKIGLQEMQSMMKKNRLKIQILQKYQQKMFSIQNTSLQTHQQLKRQSQNVHSSQQSSKNYNKNHFSPANSHQQELKNQCQDCSQSSSQQQQNFSPLMSKDLIIEIEVDDKLTEVSSFASNLTQDKHLYLLENVVRPGFVQLSQTKKTREVEFIENSLFRECEKLGKVRAIDRLSSVELKDRGDQEITGSQKGRRRNSDLLSIKIPHKRLPLERYVIEYKGRVNSNQSKQSSSKFCSSCQFIEITSQKYFYLFRLSKILRYDYWYSQKHCLRKMSELGPENIMGKRKEERKKWKLPTIIDLDQVRLQEKKLHVNRLGVEFQSQQVQVHVRENIVYEKAKQLDPSSVSVAQLDDKSQTHLTNQNIQTDQVVQTQQTPTTFQKSQNQTDLLKVVQTVSPSSETQIPSLQQQNCTEPQQTIEQHLLLVEPFEQPLSSEPVKPEPTIFQVPSFTRNAKSTSSRKSSQSDPTQNLYSSLLEFNRQGHNFQHQYTTVQSLRKQSEEYDRDQFGSRDENFGIERYGKVKDEFGARNGIERSDKVKDEFGSRDQNIRIEGQDKVKETFDEEEQDVIDELPGETFPKLSDKETKRALKKPRPKFLFSSNDDLKVTEDNSSAKKKALLSQSFSHSFQSNLSHPKPSSKPTYTQQTIAYPDPILAMHISTAPVHQQQAQQQQHQKPEQSHTQKDPIVYLLFRTHLLYFPVSNPELKTVIKIDPIKMEDTINNKTVTTAYKSEQLIVANGCYLYWISLISQQAEWKYVQRKEIYCIEVIEEMKLLAVGGKNFSKLSLFGKETSRSNIKIYNCGKSERSHLFTYDIPINEPVGNVEEIKYITTPPSGAKLLAAYTNYNSEIFRLILLRVRAYNTIEVYGRVELNDVGIQAIVGMKYNPKCQKLVVLEQVDAEHSALKRLKVKCMYEKAQVLTECIKMELGNYEGFQIGGQKQTEWYSLVSKGKNTASIYRTYKLHHNPQTLSYHKQNIEAIFDLIQGDKVIVKGRDFIKLLKKNIC